MSNIKCQISNVKFDSNAIGTWRRKLEKKIGYSYARSMRGFTLPELIITVSILLTILSLITINLSFASRRATLNTTMTLLVSDLKSQQTKAMVGDTEGRTLSDNYGIYFDEQRYVLFHGSSYNPADTANKEIELDGSQEFAEVGKTVIFQKVSGEVLSYNASADTVTLVDLPSNNQKVLEFNRYGVVTSVN